MTTMRVAIDERTKRKYKLRGELIDFEELRLRILSRDSLARLRKLHKIAEETGLRRMSMKEIDEEIRAVRDAARRS